MNCKLTLSIPAYNDEKSLQSILQDIDQLQNDYATIEFRILILDDGSKDRTLQVANDYASVHPNTTVVSHSENLGFGPTFKEAFTLPQTEWIFFLPADNQFPVINFRKMYPLMDAYDLILGKRMIRKDNWWRRTVSAVYNALVSAIILKRIHDVNSIVLFRNVINKQVVLKSSSAFVNAEFVLKARKNQYRITETDIDHRARLHGCGSGGKLHVILPVVKDIVKYIFTRK